MSRRQLLTARISASSIAVSVGLMVWAVVNAYLTH
jgi:hypothetical protein